MKSVNAMKHVSDTAYWVAAHRATESERKEALFNDPLAKVLIGEHGQKIADSMSEFSRYSYWTIVIRTLVIDDLIQKYIKNGCGTVINLGAGLDTRPYRLKLPENINWIELDFAEVIEMKNIKLKDEKPNCRLKRIAVDLSNGDERRKIFADLNREADSAILITEGVIPYLSEEVVSELAKDLKIQDNFKYWISEYYSPKIYPRFQAQNFRKLFGSSPMQFFPTDWFSFFKTNGWINKEMIYLYDESEKVGRKFPLPRWVSILKLLIGEKKIIENIRLSAYSILEKNIDYSKL